MSGNGKARARMRLEATAFIGSTRGGLAWHARQECGDDHGHGSAWPMGLGGSSGWAEAGVGRASGLGPNRKDKIFIFQNYLKCENNFRKSRNCSKGMKNTEKILKISEKF
jgi:hypothetical protein